MTNKTVSGSVRPTNSLKNAVAMMQTIQTVKAMATRGLIIRSSLFDAEKFTLVWRQLTDGIAPCVSRSPLDILFVPASFIAHLVLFPPPQKIGTNKRYSPKGFETAAQIANHFSKR